MHITHSSIVLASEHAYLSQTRVTNVQTGETSMSLRASRMTATSLQQDSSANVDLPLDPNRHQGKMLLEPRALTFSLDSPFTQKEQLNLRILLDFHRSVTGQDLSIRTPMSLPHAKSLPKQATVDVDSKVLSVSSDNVVNPQSVPVYTQKTEFLEIEKLNFKAQGVVHTADGREINFSAELAMSRRYYEETVGAAPPPSMNRIDPLVINFDGQGAALSDTRFSFDLDSDGSPEQIAMLRPGSGYLALDRNQDGIINDGSELFGPQTGFGFAELATHDEDGNGFIDEGDSIYQSLRIWMMNEDGSSQLIGLGDAQIGAIYLGHLTTPFALNDANNQSLGDVARSSIYLTEAGSVGFIQEINLTV